MAYNAVIQLPALFDVDGGSAALFGEQQVVDVMNSHLLFTLDRQTNLGNGKIGFRAPASDTDLQSLVEAFQDTFLVGDTDTINNDSNSSSSDSGLLGSGLLTDLGDAGTASHPSPTSNVLTGTFPGVKILYQNNALYSGGAHYLSDNSPADGTDAAAAAHYYYNDTDGQTKGGAIATLHYVNGALTEIQITSGGNGYVVGDLLQIPLDANIISGGAGLLTITVTAASINSDAGKMKFYVNMLGNKSGSYLPKYSEGTGQIAGPNDVVDDFCNKFADSLIKAHNSGYVNIPHPDKAIPMGGRTVTDGKAPLYGNSICPEPAEKCSLGTSMARAAAVHLVGHPLAQALFSNEDSIVNELSAMIQQPNTGNFVAGTWTADKKYDGDAAADDAGAYGETGYGSGLGGFSVARVGKQGFRFKSKLAKILSKILGGSQADERTYANGGNALENNSGTDTSLKAGNGAGQTYQQMKVTRNANDDGYDYSSSDVTAPDCLDFGVKDDINATAGNFTNGLKAVIDDEGNYYDHKQAISSTTATMTQADFAKGGFGTGLTQELVVVAASATATRGGVAAPATAKNVAFKVTVERSAVADAYTVAWKSIVATASGEGYQSGDVITLALPAAGNSKNILLTINGDNLIQSHIGNIEPNKIGDDHVANSTMAAYNFAGVLKTDGVHNEVLQSIYEQCMNVPGRATELANGRNAVITPIASGELAATGAGVPAIYDITDANANNHIGVGNVKLTDGEVYGTTASVEIALSALEMKSQFTSGADLTHGAGKIKLTIASKKITKIEVSTKGGDKFQAGDVIYVQSSDIGGDATGDIEITLVAGNITPDPDQTGTHDKPYKNNVMLTRNLAAKKCIPTNFPMKAGDRLICYLRPSLLLKFDQTLLDSDVNVQYMKSDGTLETLNVNGIVNAAADGEHGTVAATFPGLAFDANDSGNTLQEWEDASMLNTALNFVGKKVANPTHAQSNKFCWMGSSINGRSDTSTAANTALANVNAAATPAHTLLARQDAVTKPVRISQQLTDQTTENKLDLHVWKVTMSL